MDQLLQKDITAADCARGEFFGLMERMDRRIQSFIQSYGILCSRREKDLSDRIASRKTALSQLSAQQNREAQQLTQQKTDVIGQLESKIRDASQRRNSLDQQTEDQYLDWERQQQAVIDLQVQEAHDKNSADANFLAEIQAIRCRVRAILKEKKYDAIVKNTKPAPCADYGQAEALMLKYQKENRTKTQNEIFEIQNSLLKRLLFSGKRDKLCRTLEQMAVDVRAASSRLAEFRSRHQIQIMNDFDSQKFQQSEHMKRERDAHRSEFETTRRNYEQKIAAARKDFGAREVSMKQRHSTAFRQMDQRMQAEFAAAEKNWKKECADAEQRFAVQMEQEYPQGKCRDMILALWNLARPFRPDQFGTKSMAQSEAMRNVAVGEQLQNVSRWYQAKHSGPVLRKLMSERYPFLFRPVGKEGKQSCDPEYLYLPFLFSLEKGENFLVWSDDAQQETMENLLQAAAMRILWAIPVGQSRFLLGDSEKIGSFSGLLSLDPAQFNAGGTVSYKSILEGNQVWSSLREIGQQIHDNRVRYNDTAGQMGSVRSLRQYNLEHPMNRRNFLITILQKFPSGFNQENLQTLRMMSADCGKWGYSSILSGSKTNFASLDSKLQNDWKQFLGHCMCMALGARGTLVVRTSPYAAERGSFVRLYGLPDASILSRMKNDLKNETEKAGRNLICFEQAKEICPASENRYAACADRGVVVPVGYLDGGEPCRIIFDDARVHTIINGDTGSGKTNLLHVLITNTLLRYAPEEVEMYLIDFKNGTEFRKYANYNLPNFKVISLCNEPEFALQVLRSIWEEIKRRSTLFGGTITNIASYNRSADREKRLPRIIVILDELYELTDAAKGSKMSGIRGEIMRYIKEFAIQARAYGVHMVLSGQNMTEIPEIKTIKESCNTKIALRCSEQQVEALINKEAKDRMRLIGELDKGACVVQLEKSGSPQVEHTAYLEPDRQHIQLLSEIHRHYCDKKQFGYPRVLSTEVAANPQNIFMRYLQRDNLDLAGSGRFWLGEMISVKPVDYIRLDRGNLWIAGGSSQEARDAGKSLMFFVLLSLLLQQKKEKNKIFYGNGDAVSGNPAGIDDRAAELSLSLPGSVQYAAEDQIIGMLRNVYSAMTNPGQNQGKAGERIWLVLMRPEDAIRNNTQAMQLLQEILVSGPSRGIQTILYTVDPQKLSALNLPGLPFSEKLLLEMDSSLCDQEKSFRLPREMTARTNSGQRR